MSPVPLEEPKSREMLNSSSSTAWHEQGLHFESLDFQKSNHRQQHCQNETNEQDGTETFALGVIYPVRENDG